MYFYKLLLFLFVVPEMELFEFWEFKEYEEYSQYEKLFPDLSCYKGYYNPHTNLVKGSVLNETLTRGCYMEDILYGLDFIQLPPDHDLKKGWKLYDLSDGKVDRKMPHFPLPMIGLESNSLRQIVNDRAHRLCRDIMQKIIIDEKKDCKEWGPIQDCIQEAWCPSNIWPNLKCHSGIFSGKLTTAYLECEELEKGLVSSACFKACMMYKLGIYCSEHYYPTENSVRDPNEDPKESPHLLGIGPNESISDGGCLGHGHFQDFFTDAQLSQNLLKSVFTNCNEIFETLVNKEMKDCPDWDQLYVCIEKALMCS